MTMHTTFAALSFAVLPWLALAPAQAAPHGTVLVQADQHPAPAYTQGRPAYIPAPPPPRREATPRARRGQVWVAGHWEWRGHRHVWLPGTWVQARPDHHYRQPQWVQQHDGHWQMRAGGWDRDRDGDGVPNRHDRRPGNPQRH